MASLYYQIQERLREKFKYKESRHQAKKDGVNKDCIYSTKTKQNYIQVGKCFAKFCREQHPGKESKELDNCYQFVAEYLQSRIDAGLAAPTIARDASALGKIFGCDYRDFGVSIPTRNRDAISRSRNPEKNPHFSEKNNQLLIEVATSIGLRRCELSKLKGTNLVEKDGKYYIDVSHTVAKGGRVRTSLIYNPDKEIENRVIQYIKSRGDNLVFDKIHSNADIHSMRRVYANNLYNLYKRDVDSLERNEVWHCKKAAKGQNFDKQAAKKVSLNLGHSRVQVTITNYLVKK